MKKISELKNNKIIKGILTAFKSAGIIVILAFIFVVYLQRFSDNELSFFKYRMFTVISPSMEPKYVVGDVLFSKEVAPSSIKVGDDISYKGTKGDVRDKIITHRVVKVVKDDSGKYFFHAKGLENLIEDPIIEENQLYGKIVYKSLVLSIIYKIIANNIGFYLCIIIPLLVVIGTEVVAIASEREDKKRQKLK